MQLKIEPRPVSEEDLRASEPQPSGTTAGWITGCLTYIALFLIAILLSEYGPFKDFIQSNADEIVVGLFLGGAIFAAILGLLAASSSAQAQLRKWRATELAARRSKAEEEAREVTQRIHRLQGEAGTLAEELPRLVRRAEDDLEVAESEFSERAFGPFWERIASAVQALAKYNHTVDRLASLGTYYRSLLEKETHSLPERLNIPEIVPQPGHCVEKLRMLARAGQKDFEFAVIWEHHRTRRVLVEGFSTLESTLRDVGTSIEVAIDKAAAEITGLFDSSTRDLVEAVDRTRDELSERLKRIEDEFED